jgi:hypothetical protein
MLSAFRALGNANMYRRSDETSACRPRQLKKVQSVLVISSSRDIVPAMTKTACIPVAEQPCLGLQPIPPVVRYDTDLGPENIRALSTSANGCVSRE